MPGSSLSPLDRQLQRVSRRLYLQTFLSQMVWCWSAALVLASAWFFAQPHLLAEAAPWLRWVVAGGLLGVFTGAAALLAIRRCPSRLDAALSLDERFGLKERVTTSLTLAPDQVHSPVGAALLADVNQRVGSLDVPAKFPVGMPRSALVLPALAAGFACVAFLYQPPAQAVVEANDAGKQPPVHITKLEEKMKALKKRPAAKKTQQPRREELEQIEAKLEEIAHRPRKNRDELRERLKEMKSIHDKLTKREKELTDRLDRRNEALKHLDKLNEKASEGPGKQLQKALSQGNLEQAKEQLEKLAKKLDQMSTKEKKDLARQLQGMQEKLKRLADQQDKKDKLDQLKKEGKLSQEAHDRAMKELAKEGESLKDMKDLSERMARAQKSLEKGDGKGARKQMQDAADKLKKMQQDDGTLEEMRDQMDRLQDARRAGKDGMGKDGKGNGEKGKDGKGNGEKGDRADGDGDQPNDGNTGSGKRRMGREGDTRSFDAKAKVPFDSKGRKIFAGYAPGQNFKKKGTSEIIEDIEQARQEASEAIDQQRIPKSARDMAKGFFKNLGGQNTPKTAPERP